jgi:protein-tyrosine phosphatase
MIDLHSHILPGLDDGAPDLACSMEMARACVAGGVKVLACTPHIMPAVWPNSGPAIRESIADLQLRLDEAGIALRLVVGADNHLAPSMAAGLRLGRLLSLNDSRYVLVEPPHHMAPPRMDVVFAELLEAGFVPILTHPERLTWIDGGYDIIRRLAKSGVWMQITAGSLTGSFGRRPQFWAQKMLAEGLVHILASDAHDARRRPPILAEGRDAAANLVGVDEATDLVLTRPLGVLKNVPAHQLPAPLSGSKISDVRDGYDDTIAQAPGARGGPASVGAGAATVHALAGRLRRLFPSRL